MKPIPLDVDAVPSPAYVLEEAALRRNLAILDRVQRASGAKILLALKGFAFWSAFPWIRDVLPGAAASSLHEARLAHEEFGGETHVYAVAFADAEVPQILDLADHITFNSLSQWRRFKAAVAASPRRISPGLRVNPEHSEIATPLYDPCAAHSRLGVTRDQCSPGDVAGIEGLHLHAHCGNEADVLERTMAAFEDRFGAFIPAMKWINIGGGHAVTRQGYDVERLIRVLTSFRARYGVEVYLELGEAVGWQTGPLVASVLDVVRNGMEIAVLDVSATAHMPDVLEMPYRPEVRGAGLPGALAHTYRLGGLTCLAGDVIGDYSFERALEVGDRVVFEDMIHYTIVKSTTFNGVNLPSLCVWTADGTLRVIRRFGYEDYKRRNS